MSNTVKKKIASVRVVEAGSAPDVDTDFHTAYRDRVLEHCEDLYGRGKLANIVTFTTSAAKAALKTMCTIYEVPFAQANKIASLIPGPIEGKDCTFDDIFDPESPRYSECSDFRTAVAGAEWTKIIRGARAIAGRVKATGVHPCGVVISSRPLIDTVPLQIRQADQRVITQWTYPELESMGLLKFDFLGLDTVDLIAHTVEYIQKAGKNPPNMVELIHGDMRDKKTYEMLTRGETDGVFQLSSDGVKDLLRRMRPDSVDDIVATTALFRPGPMGMKSHVRYADRKNGREKIDYVHPDFDGSPLEQILAKTYGLVVYQEQVMQIANQIGGMTLQEGDKLRKAMGKKQKAIMEKMKPKFMSGGQELGYSAEGLEVLWSTMAVFAEYGFNLSHSVSYAINAYQAAYLKANYRVEFMAALISQNIGRKEKILAYLQEAKRMKLNVGSAHINLSDVKVAPDYTGKSEYDIVYGLSGINAVSEDMAALIVKEREQNGPYKSVQDCINRCSPLGVTNRKIYENLTLAGAFDEFGGSRRGVVENLGAMLNESKKKTTKGASLFDMLGAANEAPEGIDIAGVEEYSHLEKLKKESDVIGLYLTSHPLANAGSLGALRSAPIDKALKSTQQATFRLVGSITDIEVKRQKRGGKSVAVIIDDGTGFIKAFLHKNIVKGLDKRVAQEKIKSLYESGATELPAEVVDMALTPEYDVFDELEIGQIYSVELVFRPGSDENPYGARIMKMHRVNLAHDGSLPVRIRLNRPAAAEKKAAQAKFLKALSAKFPGDSPIFVGYHGSAAKVEGDEVYMDAVDAIKASDSSVVQAEAATHVEEQALTGTVKRQLKKKAGAVKENARTWPPPKQERGAIFAKAASSSITAEGIESLDYRPTKLFVEKSSSLSMAIEKKIGIENYDFGVFNPDLLD